MITRTNPPPVSGTREWAVASENNTKGCRNSCAYCYARARALRSGRIKTPAEWAEMTTRRRRPTKRYDGTVMFPTTHDIFPENLDACVETLRSLLEHGNRVLIVSKPRLDVIETLVMQLAPWRDRVLFRFTIGTLDERLSKIWEPGAPPPEERAIALRVAREWHYETSVSMEPMLNPHFVVHEFATLAPRVSQAIWLGKMNKIRERVRGVPSAEVERLSAAQADSEIHLIYDALKHEPKVRWKESVKLVIGLPFETEAGTDR